MRKKDKQRAYYFSDKLKNQLVRIPLYPVTVVEAPSGFGKTTAVREYLRENLSSEDCEYWYTCLGEPSAVAWRGVCELFANINGEMAENLKSLGMPTMDTLMYLLTAFRELRCTAETYLVIDNYHLLDCGVPRELFSVFGLHGCPHLHIIFITQQLGATQQFTLPSADIHTIDSSAFFFDREGVAALFRMEGIRLSAEEVEKVFISTEGWVSALRLQIINYEENGTFDHNAGIEHLVEAAIWNKLNPEEKEFLQAVSIAESFTPRQAAAMMGRETLPERIEELLKTNDFIRYFPDKGLYVIHSILGSYLQNRFYYHQPEAFQQTMLRRAGASFMAMGQYYPAAQYFLKVKDYDAILALPFNAEYLGNQKEKNFLDFVIALLEECPEETLLRYPYALMTFASQAYLGGELQQYQKICRLIEKIIENDHTLSEEERRRIRGEFLILQGIAYFNDIGEMGERIRTAGEILKEPSRQFGYDTPFTFGCPSVLFLYWRESGQLENELNALDAYLPVYRKLTKGHGSGANSVMRAEAMLMRGDDEEAEILCHKALYEARSRRQTAICLCAELVLARVAILRGDADGYFIAVKNIQRYTENGPNLYILRMGALCLTTINLALGDTENVAPCLENMENIKKIFYTPALPYAQMQYAALLLGEKRYNEFYGLADLIMDMDGNGTGNIHYILPQVYHYKYLAAIKLNSGKKQEGLEYLQKALALALPDKIYLPFVPESSNWDSLLEEARKTVSDKAGMNDLVALCKRHEKGVGVIKKALQANKSPLTPREREIALLSRDRLSAKEIAEKLYIAEATVRTILRSIYSKLDIHSRSELQNIDF
ncbi:MAG: LuxR C-terminal-related transcriptional regulator [Clostridia bacterium]|jgi:LuxR family maltose regulon positive regulatory protein|nr:LuxR C-terminal-related transcriptional regulator [Clostridia bacterium]